jgi:hypothetical protein
MVAVWSTRVQSGEEASVASASAGAESVADTPLPVFLNGGSIQTVVAAKGGASPSMELTAGARNKARGP